MKVNLKRTRTKYQSFYHNQPPKKLSQHFPSIPSIHLNLYQMPVYTCTYATSQASNFKYRLKPLPPINEMDLLGAEKKKKKGRKELALPRRRNAHLRFQEHLYYQIEQKLFDGFLWSKTALSLSIPENCSAPFPINIFNGLSAKCLLYIYIYLLNFGSSPFLSL